MTPKTEQKVYVGIGMDFETGGLDCRECACTQIALQAVRFDTWQVFDHCQAYIAPLWQGGCRTAPSQSVTNPPRTGEGSRGCPHEI